MRLTQAQEQQFSKHAYVYHEIEFPFDCQEIKFPLDVIL